MKLSRLDRQPAFALLGPGFGRAPFTLLGALRQAEGPGDLFFAPYEAAVPLAFVGEVHELDDLDWDVGPAVLEPEVGLAGYADAVAIVREAIARGDVYEVNLTVRARFRCASAAAVFARLARLRPRYCAWVRTPGGAEFVSASPELLFAIDGDRVRAEPMKGTAAPDALPALQASRKDESELAMITDLLRHELTPLCLPGTVEVPCERRFVSLPYAVQAVSDVTGRLASATRFIDVLSALHPGGSVTGAPKRAARALIARLETLPRGAYCGSLAFLQGPRVRCSLLIRTAERQGPDTWVYGTGGAIVWESDADQERSEILLKLGALR